MALVKSTLEIDLALAFKELTWTTCATKIATAVDNYLKAGTISAAGIAALVPPLPAVPYTLPYTCTGTLTTLGPTPLATAIAPAFLLPVWAGVGTIIATGIGAHVTAILIVISTYTPPLIGVGTGVCTAAVALPILVTALEASILLNDDWNLVASDMATAIDIFVKAGIIATVDAGVILLNTWTGAGVGVIV
jgi:hypothetical protein